MVPVIILGGIYGGIMTPTEAAAVSALYGLLVGCFVYREINLSNITGCVMEACSTSAIVIVLIAMARDTYRTPLEALAIVGSRVLRHAVCDMTPAELDVVLASLERQGYITPYEDTDGTVGRRIGILNREHAQEGPWKAWRLNIDGKETGR